MTIMHAAVDCDSLPGPSAAVNAQAALVNAAIEYVAL
jgi:hypothetical protein